MKGIVSAISFLLPARRYPSTQRAIASGGSVLREEHHGDMIRSIIPEELDLTVGSSDFRHFDCLHVAAYTCSDKAYRTFTSFIALCAGCKVDLGNYSAPPGIAHDPVR